MTRDPRNAPDLKLAPRPLGRASPWLRRLARRERVLTLEEKAAMRGFVIGDAQLDRVDFSETDLRDARFFHCSLVECDFKDADLRGAAFEDCDLRRAEFHRARLGRSSFGRSWLTGAAGLSSFATAYVRFQGGRFLVLVDERFVGQGVRA